MLTEAEAWREIARRIVAGEWAKEGLCREITELSFRGLVSWEVGTSMSHRIQFHIDYISQFIMWAYPRGEEPEGRALAALWMALEAEEEYTNQRAEKSQC
jgi:hypothetical protein